MLGGLPSNVPLPGELFAEKYRIERVLGRGGMGVVFAATHLYLKQRLALKLLLPTSAADPETVERFLREGRAAVQIRNEHVARVIDVGELPDRTPYIVMEYLEGQDFAELLDGADQLPFATAVDYVLQACEAVAEAHSLKIVHRDLKPSNLFLAKQPDGGSIVKVLDFGISKTLDPDLAMTRTAAMIGSPIYMSPEQLKSAKDVDARADIWSIGVILYQLIAGHPPFLADSMPELCALVLSSPTRWLHREVPDVPAALSRIVATCLRTKLEERFANLADFADAVAPFGTAAARVSAEKITARLGLPEPRMGLAPLPIDPSLTETRSEPVRSKRTWIVGGALGAAAIAAVVLGTRPSAHASAAIPEPPPASAPTAPTAKVEVETPPAPVVAPSASVAAVVEHPVPHRAPPPKPPASVAKPVVEPVVTAAPKPVNVVPSGIATSAKD